MPRFWTFLTRQWLGLDEGLAWNWWRAITKSSWEECGALRDTIVRCSTLPFPGQAMTADRMAFETQVEPARLMGVLEDLATQHLLLRRDATKIQDAVLARLDAAGRWRHEKELR